MEKTSYYPLLILLLLSFFITYNLFISNDWISNNWDNFERNKECREIFDSKESEQFTIDYTRIDNLEKKDIILKENVDEIFYSHSTNSCLFSHSLITSNITNEILTFNKQYYIIDLLSKEYIYVDNFYKEYQNTNKIIWFNEEVNHLRAENSEKERFEYIEKKNFNEIQNNSRLNDFKKSEWLLKSENIFKDKIQELKN